MKKNAGNKHMIESLQKQLSKCRNRIEGHLNSDNSNMERFFRLIRREAELSNELSKLTRTRRRKPKTTEKKD
jgi:hypothetical protein